MKTSHTPLHLGLQFHGGTGWMGGTIYVRNLIYCLANLPDAERPQVRLIGVLNAPDDFIDKMNGFDFVSMQKSYGEVRKIGPFAELFSKLTSIAVRLIGPQANPENWGCNLIYPVLRSQGDTDKQIFWIPDFQHLRMPEMFTEKERALRTQTYGDIANSRGILVLSSGDALMDFNKFFPDAIVEPRIWNFHTVLTDNEGGGRSPYSQYGIPEKYLYVPNQFWAHKDHMSAFKALGELKKRGVIIPLVCTGAEKDSRNAEHMNTLKEVISEYDLEDQVHFLGLVPRNDQVEIFRHAAAVLQPSLFEGWSTVVEDARAIGRPIILSDISVHVEQNPDRAHYFKAGDVADLARVVDIVWPDLEAGPDVEAEEKALIAGRLNQKSAGQVFMDIVSEANKIKQAPYGK